MADATAQGETNPSHQLRLVPHVMDSCTSYWMLLNPGPAPQPSCSWTHRSTSRDWGAWMKRCFEQFVNSFCYQNQKHSCMLIQFKYRRSVPTLHHLNGSSSPRFSVCGRFCEAGPPARRKMITNHRWLEDSRFTCPEPNLHRTCDGRS